MIYGLSDKYMKMSWEIVIYPKSFHATHETQMALALESYTVVVVALVLFVLIDYLYLCSN